MNKEHYVIGPVRSVNLEGIGKISKRALWSRQDAIASVNAKKKFEAVIDGFRIEKSPVRIARVKRVRGGYHVAGFGRLAGVKMNEVRTLLKENGYTGFRKAENENLVAL